MKMFEIFRRDLYLYTNGYRRVFIAWDNMIGIGWQHKYNKNGRIIVIDRQGNIAEYTIHPNTNGIFKTLRKAKKAAKIFKKEQKVWVVAYDSIIRGRVVRETEENMVPIRLNGGEVEAFCRWEIFKKYKDAESHIEYLRDGIF